MSANDVSVDRPKRASLADGLLGNYSSRDALARYLPPLSTNNIGASSGKPNATDAITFFFDSSASTPSKNFTSDKDNSSNYPYSVPEISDEFDADKFNSNPGIPFPHEENHNSQAAVYSDGADEDGGVDVTPSEPYYESLPRGDTSFRYSGTYET
jgi:hypothetical protein